MREMRKFWCRLSLPLMAILLLSLSLAGCGGQEASKTQAPAEKSDTTKPAAKASEYKVGLVISLTGGASVWGQPMKNSIELAVSQINAKGGVKGVPLKLVTLDDESDPAKSLLAAKKLVADENVLAVIGSAASPTSMSMVKYLEESKVPMLTMGSSDALITPIAERHFIFKPLMRSQFMAEAILGHLKATGAKKVALLAASDAYGDSGVAAMQSVAKTAGVQLAVTEKFAATDKDMKPQLTRIRAADADAIVVWAIPPAASLINKNYKELGIKAPLIHSYGAASGYYISLAGKENVEGTYMVMDKTWVASGLQQGDVQRKLIEEYESAYKAKYNEEISPTAAGGYDNVLLVAKALETSGPDRVALDKALESIKDFVTVTGKVNMSAEDHNGHTLQDYVVAQMSGGQWKVVYQGK